MSILVNPDGTTKNYVAADYASQTIVAAFNWAGEADKGVRELSRGRATPLVFHNLTHPKIPDWLKEVVRSDPDYCLAMAIESEKKAAGLRAKAAVLEAEAAGHQETADEWRRRAEQTSAPNP